MKINSTQHLMSQKGFSIDIKLMRRLVSFLLVTSLALTNIGCVTILKKTELKPQRKKTLSRFKTARLRLLGEVEYSKDKFDNELPFEIVESEEEKSKGHKAVKLAPFKDYDPPADCTLEVITNTSQTESTSVWPSVLTFYLYPRYYTMTVTTSMRLQNVKTGSTKVYFRQGEIKMKEGVFVPGVTANHNAPSEYSLEQIRHIGNEIAQDIYEP